MSKIEKFVKKSKILSKIENFVKKSNLFLEFSKISITIWNFHKKMFSATSLSSTVLRQLTHKMCRWETRIKFFDWSKMNKLNVTRIITCSIQINYLLILFFSAFFFYFCQNIKNQNYINKWVILRFFGDLAGWTPIEVPPGFLTSPFFIKY